MKNVGLHVKQNHMRFLNVYSIFKSIYTRAEFNHKSLQKTRNELDSFEK